MQKITMAWSGLGIAALTLFAAPGRADEKGERILREAFKKINESQAMTATLTQTLDGENVNKKVITKGAISAMKPNLLLVRITTQVDGSEKPDKSEVVFAATGKDYITYNSQSKIYRKDKLEANPTEFNGEWEGEIDAFFGGEKLLAKGTANYAGLEKVGEAPCNIVKMTIPAKGEDAERVITYFVGMKDHLIHKTSFIVHPADGVDWTQSNLLTDINLKAAKKAEDFQYSPPKDAKPEAPKRELIL